MGKNNIEYRHFFTVDDKGSFVWEEPDMLNFKREMLKGKRGYAIIEEVEENWTQPQLAYYFGGMIHGECMNSNCFVGLNDKQIHDILWAEYSEHIVVYHDKSGKPHQRVSVKDFHSIGKKQMSQYIEWLIPHLLEEYGIEVKPSENYKLNKYYIKPKKE